MTQERLLVGVYWPPRDDTPEQVAQVLFDTGERLTRLDPLFARWHLGQEQPVQDVANLLGAVRSGQVRDDEGRPSPSFGSSLTLFSQPGAASGAILRAAVLSRTGPAPNSLVLTPAFQGQGHDVWHRLLSDVLRVLVETWAPAWGVGGTHRALNVQREVLGVPGANLLTWRPGPPPPGLPDGVTTSQIAGGALLDARRQGDSEDDVDTRVLAVARALVEADLQPAG